MSSKQPITVNSVKNKIKTHLDKGWSTACWLIPKELGEEEIKAILASVPKMQEYAAQKAGTIEVVSGKDGWYYILVNQTQGDYDIYRIDWALKEGKNKKIRLNKKKYPEEEAEKVLKHVKKFRDVSVFDEGWATCVEVNPADVFAEDMPKDEPKEEVKKPKKGGKVDVSEGIGKEEEEDDLPF